jgi:hypothetical protein
MAKGGSRITPFLLNTKTKGTCSDDTRPPQSPTQARASSSSSVFPSLRKLETATTDRPRTAPGSSGLSRAVSASAKTSSATSSSSPYGTPIVTLKLTGPSFLDVVAKDGVTKQPLYIMETVRDSTFVYRLDGASNEAVKAATVQWPQHITKKTNAGRTVQMHNGRWHDTEEFLKFGTLTNFLYVSPACPFLSRASRSGQKLTNWQEPKILFASLPPSAQMEAGSEQHFSCKRNAFSTSSTRTLSSDSTCLVHNTRHQGSHRHTRTSLPQCAPAASSV